MATWSCHKLCLPCKPRSQASHRVRLEPSSKMHLVNLLLPKACSACGAAVRSCHMLLQGLWPTLSKCRHALLDPSCSLQQWSVGGDTMGDVRNFPLSIKSLASLSSRAASAAMTSNDYYCAKGQAAQPRIRDYAKLATLLDVALSSAKLQFSTNLSGLLHWHVTLASSLHAPCL